MAKKMGMMGMVNGAKGAGKTKGKVMKPAAGIKLGKGQKGALAQGHQKLGKMKLKGK